MMRTRNGNVAVTVSISSAVLLSLAALVVDLGYARVVDAQLQNAADAAAHAGTARLDRTEAGLTAARELAVQVAGMHVAGGAPVVLQTADVITGVWDYTAGTFTQSADPLQVNAVRVSAKRNALSLFFAPAAVGTDTLDLAANSHMTSIQSGASAVDCYLPLALPSCIIDKYTVEGLNDITLQLNPATGDNVGYARANGAVNASFVRDQAYSCTAAGTARVGDTMTLGNGELVSALDSVKDAVVASQTLWSTERWGTQPSRLTRSSIPAASYGRTWEGAVIVFDGGPEYCTGGGSWNGSTTIEGFVWGAVYDVQNQGSVHERVLRMRLDTQDEHDAGVDGGGPDYGVQDFSPPRMVSPS